MTCSTFIATSIPQAQPINVWKYLSKRWLERTYRFPDEDSRERWIWWGHWKRVGWIQRPRAPTVLLNIKWVQNNLDLDGHQLRHWFFVFRGTKRVSQRVEVIETEWIAECLNKNKVASFTIPKNWDEESSFIVLKWCTWWEFSWFVLADQPLDPSTSR